MRSELATWSTGENGLQNKEPGGEKRGGKSRAAEKRRKGGEGLSKRSSATVTITWEREGDRIEVSVFNFEKAELEGWREARNDLISGD